MVGSVIDTSTLVQMLQSMQKERRAVRGRRKGVYLASSVVYIILYGHDEIDM